MADLTSRLLIVINASSAGAVQELGSLQRQADKSGTAFDTIGKKAGLAGSTIKAGLVAGATALVGTGLVSFLGSAVDKFGDSAKAAGDLARATGGSAETVSRMTAALQDAGVSSETSAALLTKFTTNAGKSKASLDQLGVVLKTNRDGSVDYADAMVQTVDAIGRIGDASKRNQTLVQLFGKQGAAAFQDLYASGVDLSEAMEAISKYRVFTSGDVARAVAYDDAMDTLGASVQGLQFALGRNLIPAVAGAADALAGLVDVATPVIGFLQGIPTETYAVVGAFAALKGTAAFLGQPLSSALSAGTTALTGLGAAAEAAGGKAGLLKSGLGSLVNALSPFNLAVVGLAAAVTAISIGADNAQGRLKEFAATLDGTETSLQTSAAAMLETSSAWERFWVTLTDNSEGLGPGTWTRILNEALAASFGAGTEGADAYEAALRKLREEEGALAAGSADLAVRQRELGDMLREGGYSAEELAAAITQSGDAMNDQNAATEAASGYMDAYESSTRKAADATLALFDKQFAAQDAQRSYNDSIREYDEALKNSEATADERAAALQGIGEAAIDAAAAQSEAARQQDLLNGVYQDSTVYTQMTIEALKQLSQQPGLPAEAKANIDGFITSLEAAQTKAGAGIEVDASVTADTASADTAVEVLKRRIRDAGQAGNQGQVSALSLQLVPAATNTTVTVTTAGVPQAQAQIDALAAARSTTLTVNTDFSPDGYLALKDRKDYLSQNRWATITNNVLFSPDGYAALKDRKDYLSQNRTAIITQVINQVRGSSVAGGIDGDPGTPWSVQRIPNVYANVQPVNIVRVSVDGTPLRAWIRAEVGAAPTVQAVA